ncbi:MAG: TIR domain-containing protein [Candidatus Omnitrophota bacterium]
MAKLPVEIIEIPRDHSSDLMLAIEEANRVQDQIYFSMLDQPFADSMRLHVFIDTHSEQFLDALAKKKKEWRGFHPFIICVIDSAIHSNQWSNLFGSRRSKQGMSLFTSFSVEKVIIPKGKMIAYYLYEIATHALSFVVPGLEYHEESRGCIFDFKQEKLSILECMRVGILCDECRNWFLTNGENLSPSQLSAFEHLLRKSSELLEQTSPDSITKEEGAPRIFIGSSIEGLDVARAIQSELHCDYSVEIWNQNTVFGLGSATIEALEKAVNTYEFGIFIFSPDDLVERRGQVNRVPRDNVIFEVGLFIGKLGRFRSFIVHPKGVDIQLPTDLRGLTTAIYNPNSSNIDAAVGPACQQIRLAIKKNLSSGNSI